MNLENPDFRIEGRTLIQSNGNTGAFRAPEPLEKLYEALEKSTLDPLFEQFHCWESTAYRTEFRNTRESCFLDDWQGGHSYFGNFVDVSHVFSVVTFDPEVKARLDQLIASNTASEKYQALSSQRYADWYVAEFPDGHQLIPKKLAEDIMAGCYPSYRYSLDKVHRYRQAIIHGPRYPQSQAA